MYLNTLWYQYSQASFQSSTNYTCHFARTCWFSVQICQYFIRLGTPLHVTNFTRPSPVYLSEPHTSELNGGFLYIMIIYIFTLHQHKQCEWRWIQGWDTWGEAGAWTSTVAIRAGYCAEKPTNRMQKVTESVCWLVKSRAYKNMRLE